MKKNNIQQVKAFSPAKVFCLAIALISISAIGFAQVSVYNYATGNVSGRYDVGGLTGRIADQGGLVLNSYARGSVTGTARTGGLAGSNSGTVKNTYSSGRVTGTSQTGGLVGSGTGTVTGSYWDMESSGVATSAGGTGRNTDPMTWPYASDTYTGWDFPTVWKSDQAPFQNGGYPLLSTADLFRVSVQVYPPGSGTVSGEGYYPSGQLAQLGITADSRYVFKGWMKNTEVVGTTPQLSLMVSGHTSLVALFESKTTAVQPGLSKKIPGLMLYPNPAKEILYVNFSVLPDKPVSVTVVNMTGQTMIRKNAPHERLTTLPVIVSGLKPGVYMVLVQHGSGFLSERFVKQ